MMRIHAIQTGTVAIKQSQTQGKGHGQVRRVRTLLDRHWTAPLPIFAWVIEHPEGLIVIDTGETAQAMTPGYFPRLNPYFRWGVREWVQSNEEIGPRLQALGFAPTDVRWLVLTHLHTDHAGGLHHFPGVEILVSRAEYQLAQSRVGRLSGYLPQHWPQWFAPHLIDWAGPTAGPFPQSYPLTRAVDVTLIPTPGHTPGHLSVLLHDGDQTICFAGDTSYTQDLMLAQAVDGVASNEQVARATLRRINELAAATPLIYLPSHDPQSAQRLEERIPVPTMATAHPVTQTGK